ncbi:uncharacterized protein LOC123228487 [Mangifera indica]|uniref:uncharacterized protein LOC123228487 n=1 Tax=Mangifera indica TaxID=29780 RepID=UPI001CFC15FD|nr:uncharacterized protein LOC123228487 [Mangifera indica]
MGILDYSRAAITKIHNVFTEHCPDEDTRSKIAKNFAVAAVKEGLEFVPGGSRVYNIVHRSLSHDKKPRGHEIELQELKDKVRGLEKELSEHRRLIVQTQIHRPVMELDCNNTLSLSQKPEDMIRVFMMTGFVSKHLRDNLIVPGVRSGKPNTKRDQ